MGFPLVFLSTQLVAPSGTAALPVPIPNNPNLLGLDLFFQWAVLDPAGPFLGDFAVSGGLQAHIGS